MLGKHLEKEHVGLLYSCNFCQKELLFPEILEDHMQKLHKPSGFAITSCHDCNMLSGTLEPLMKHMAFSHVSDLFSCNGCDGDAFDKRSLQKHLRANHGAVVVGHEGALEVGRGGNDNDKDDEPGEEEKLVQGREGRRGKKKQEKELVLKLRVDNKGEKKEEKKLVQEGEDSKEDKKEEKVVQEVKGKDVHGMDEVTAGEMRPLVCVNCNFFSTAKRMKNRRDVLVRHMPRCRSKAGASGLMPEPPKSAGVQVATPATVQNISATVWVQRCTDVAGNEFYLNTKTGDTARERPAGPGVQVVSEAEGGCTASKRKGGAA